MDGHSIDANNNFKGMANYLASGVNTFFKNNMLILLTTAIVFLSDYQECDAIPGTLVPDARRLSKMDFVAGFIYSPGVLLIQRPDATTDVASVVKPFQPLVCISSIT